MDLGRVVRTPHRRRQRRASYQYRTTFDLTGYDPNTASLMFRYAVDNFDFGYSLNGAALTLGPGGFTFGSTQTLSNGFITGLNGLTISTSGDASTDGLIIDVQGFSAPRLPGTTAPETATIALTATGLLALAGWRARRRSA
jgi:hypothetical protein